MTNVFAVVGQHRRDSGRLLLLGEDGRYYAYDADGRPSAVEPTGAWVLDAAPSPTGSAAPVVVVPTPSYRPDHLGQTAATFLGWLRRPLPVAVVALALLIGALIAVQPALAHAPATATTTGNLRAEPRADATLCRMVPASTAAELTGAAAADQVEIVAAGRPNWAGTALHDASGARPPMAADLNLRAAPAQEAPVLRVVPTGTTLAVTGATGGDVVAVPFVGTTGWSTATYIV